MKHACFACFLITLVSIISLAQTNPLPLVNQPLVPDATSPGGPAFTLTVNGTGFVSGSVINWNGSPLTTTFVSQSQLTATVPAANIANPTTASVTVSSPGTPASNVQFFSVFNPIATLGFSNYADLFPTQLFPWGFATGDFNGDGRLDVAATGQAPPIGAQGNEQSLIVLLGAGDGSFLTPIIYWDQQYYSSVVTGDFNGDGKLDVAAAPYNGPGAVFLGNGDGTFQPPKAFATGSGITYPLGPFFTADFNGDGNLDLALGFSNNDGSTGIAVFLGNGDGTFQNALDSPGNLETLYPEAVGDFNGDGKLDVAGSCYTNSGAALFVMLGNSDGTFQAPLVTPLKLLNVEQILTADFNGDGILDLAMTGNSAGSNNEQVPGIWILLGNGDATFQTPVEYGKGMTVGSLAIVDLNADGRIDLSAEGDGSSQGFLVFLGNGDGTFQNPLGFPSSNPPFLPGDFNGDGRMDMAWPPEALLSGSFPIATPTPYPVAFPQVTFGNSSAPQNVSLTNTGPATLTLGGISLTGADVADFAQNNNCGATLAPNASCQIAVSFTPTALGTRNAGVSIADNAPGTPQIVPMSGFSSGPAVTLSPSTITFPGQYVGTSGLPQSVQIMNSGNAVLNIGSVATNPTADFGPVDSCGNSLAVGATCSIAVFFDPAASGQVTGTLTIADNAVGSPQIIQLSGAGQDFSLITGPNPSATIKPGETAKYTISVMPAGGFKQTVALTCSGAPADSACSLTPSLITLDGSKVSAVEVSIATAGSSAALIRPANGPSARHLLALYFAFSGITGLMLFAGSGKRSKGPGAALLLLLSAAIVMTSCGGGTMSSTEGNTGNGNGGGGTPGTAQGTYTILVTGSFSSGSSKLAHSAKLTLIVH